MRRLSLRREGFWCFIKRKFDSPPTQAHVSWHKPHTGVTGLCHPYKNLLLFIFMFRVVRFLPAPFGAQTTFASVGYFRPQHLCLIPRFARCTASLAKAAFGKVLRGFLVLIPRVREGTGQTEHLSGSPPLFRNPDRSLQPKKNFKLDFKILPLPLLFLLIPLFPTASPAGS